MVWHLIQSCLHWHKTLCQLWCKDFERIVTVLNNVELQRFLSCSIRVYVFREVGVGKLGCGAGARVTEDFKQVELVRWIDVGVTRVLCSGMFLNYAMNPIQTTPAGKDRRTDRIPTSPRARSDELACAPSISSITTPPYHKLYSRRKYWLNCRTKDDTLQSHCPGP